MKIIRFFLTNNVQFLEVKFSIYLYRPVFVMVIWSENCHKVGAVSTYIGSYTSGHFICLIMKVHMK